MNKQNNKKGSPFAILIFLIVFVVYVVTVFSVSGFKGHEGKYWVSFGFAMCAFVSWLSCFFLLKSRTNQPKDWLFGFPVIRHCVIYSIIDFALSTVFMIIDKVDFSLGIVFAIQLIPLAIHAVFVISCFYAKEKIEEVQNNAKRKVSYIRNIQSSVEVIMGKVEDAALKQKLDILWEEIRYSDPMSDDGIAMLESQIAQVINMIDSSITVDDLQTATLYCDKAIQMVKERAIKVRTMQ